MHLLIITFGDNEQNHAQAYFCVYSFLAAKAGFSSINIFTDKPAMYKALEQNVQIATLTQDMLSEWKGQYDYFWRIKVKALELLAGRYPNEPVLYMDSDVFLYGDFEKVKAIASSGRAAMHECEGVLKDLKPKSHRRMCSGLNGITIEGVNGFGNKNMWNAGAILSPNTKGGAEFALALKLIDEMCRRDIQRYFVEQFSVSVAMAAFYQLEPLEPFLVHYWSNKAAWNKMMNKFLLENHLMGVDTEKAIQRFSELQLSSLPIKRRESNTKRRLGRAIDKWFPDKNIVFLKR